MPPLCESSLPAIESELQLLGNPPLGESPSTRTGMTQISHDGSEALAGGGEDVRLHSQLVSQTRSAGQVKIVIKTI